MKKNEPLTEGQLAKIKARAEAATPGPWQRCTSYGIGVESGNGPVPLKVAWAAQENDAAFISAARADVPALLEEVERLRAETKALKNSAFEFGVVFSTKVNEMMEREDWLITQILGKNNIFSCPMPEKHKCEQRDGHLCYLDPSKTEIRRQCWRKAADMATRENPGESG